MKRDNLVLTGFMGSGKTTLGLKLSYKLRRTMEDTDRLIERREGCAVSGIFAEKGEEYFRRLETAVLGELLERKQKMIIALGGGTPVRQENRELIRQLGQVVFLRVRPETVCRRLKGDPGRPLLMCGNPQERVRELLEARREAYESLADLILDVDDKSADEIAETLAEWAAFRENVPPEAGRA